MLQTVSVTSKRQVTIPVVVYDQLGLKQGQRLLVFAEKNRLIMEPAEFLVEKLAGSIPIPKKFAGKTTEKMIIQAKREYFSSLK